MVKYPPANAGDTGNAGSIPGLGRSSGGERDNPLQYLAWRIPWTEEPGEPQSMGHKESDTTEGLSTAHELRRMNSTQVKSRSTVASSGFISTLAGQVRVLARLVHLGSQPSQGLFSICSSRFIPLSVR